MSKGSFAAIRAAKYFYLKVVIDSRITFCNKIVRFGNGNSLDEYAKKNKDSMWVFEEELIRDETRIVWIGQDLYTSPLYRSIWEVKRINYEEFLNLSQLIELTSEQISFIKWEQGYKESVCHFCNNRELGFYPFGYVDKKNVRTFYFTYLSISRDGLISVSSCGTCKDCMDSFIGNDTAVYMRSYNKDKYFS